MSTDLRYSIPAILPRLEEGRDSRDSGMERTVDMYDYGGPKIYLLVVTMEKSENEKH